MLRISASEAARRARISESRWRQIVSQAKGSAPAAAAPARTVVAMATAVGVEPGEALRAAGYEVTEESLIAMLRDGEASSPRPPVQSQKLVDEIERIKGMRHIPPNDRIRMVRALVDLYEEQAAAADN